MFASPRNPLKTLRKFPPPSLQGISSNSLHLSYVDQPAGMRTCQRAPQRTPTRHPHFPLSLARWLAVLGERRKLNKEKNKNFPAQNSMLTPLESTKQP
jgi:hypothetical protein